MKEKSNFGTSVTCLRCGWVYGSVSRAYAVNQVAEFNTYFATLSPEIQERYYGGKGATLDNYLTCWCGNSYKNFRESKPGDVPDGCTIGPILDYKEEVKE